MYWQSFSLHATNSLPRPAMELRRRNAMETVSDTTPQVKVFEGMRLTGGLLCGRHQRRGSGALRARALEDGRVARAYQYLQ
jgi:hypothetical protein